MKLMTQLLASHAALRFKFIKMKPLCRKGHQNIFPNYEIRHQ
jgi:hypothetical protein